MATTILLKRGTKEAVLTKYPTGWNVGEPIFCTNTGELLIGLGLGKFVTNSDGSKSYFTTYKTDGSTVADGTVVITVDTDLDLPALDIADPDILYLIKSDSKNIGMPSLAVFSSADGAYNRVGGGSGGGGSYPKFTASNGCIQYVGNGTNSIDIKMLTNTKDGLLKLDSTGKVSADFLRDGSNSKVFTAAHKTKIDGLDASLLSKADKSHRHEAYDIIESSNLNFMSDSEKVYISQLPGIINSLSAGINWKGTVNTYAQLTSFSSPENGMAIFVDIDETHGGGRSLYVYNTKDGGWRYLGDFATTPAATVGSKGIVQLAGDLTGTAETPRLADIAGLEPGEYTSPTIIVDKKGRITSVTENADTYAIIADGLYGPGVTWSSDAIQAELDKLSTKIVSEVSESAKSIGTLPIDETGAGVNKVLTVTNDENGVPKLVYSDMAIASLINDAVEDASDSTYSSHKIEQKLAGKANIVHAHDYVKPSELAAELIKKAPAFDETLLHEAKQVGTMTLDESNVGNGRVLVYNTIGNRLEFVNAAASGEIKDGMVATDTSWSSDKVSQELLKKSDKSHDHEGVYVKPADLIPYAKTDSITPVIDTKIQQSIAAIDYSPYAKTDETDAKIASLHVNTLAKQTDLDAVKTDLANNYSANAVIDSKIAAKFASYSPEGLLSDIDAKAWFLAKEDALKVDDTIAAPSEAAKKVAYSADKISKDFSAVNTMINSVAVTAAGKIDKEAGDLVYAPKVHNHDALYVKPAEMDSALDTKSNIGHVHVNDHASNVIGSKVLDESTIANGMCQIYDAGTDSLKYGFPAAANIVAGNNIRISQDENGIVTVTATIEDWKPRFIYKINDYCFNGGIMYRALLDHESALTFSQDMATGVEKWASMGASAGGAGANLSQVTKLGVVATAQAPKIVELVIPDSPDLKRPAVEVLKFVPGTTNIIQTICQFDNADASSFVCDGIPADQHPDLIFDGTMKLRTQYDIPMTNGGPLGTGNLWIATIDTTKFKTIESIQVI